MQHSIGRPTSSGRIPPRRAAARGIARPGANDNVGGTPSRRPQCRTAEQAIRRMSEEAPGDPGRHLVDALVSISPDRGRSPTDRRPTRRRKDSAVDVPLGCPLPAVLPAVSRSVRRFLTRSDPQSPSVFPTNAGFLGDFAESGTGSKPGTRRTSSRSSTCSTVAPPSARTGHQDPRDRNRTSPIILIHLGVRAPLALRAPTRNLSSTSLRRPRSARRAPTSRPSRNPCTAKAQRARGRGVPPTPPQLLFTSNRRGAVRRGGERPGAALRAGAGARERLRAVRGALTALRLRSPVPAPPPVATSSHVPSPRRRAAQRVPFRRTPDIAARRPFGPVQVAAPNLLEAEHGLLASQEAEPVRGHRQYVQQVAKARCTHRTAPCVVRPSSHAVSSWMSCGFCAPTMESCPLRDQRRTRPRSAACQAVKGSAAITTSRRPRSRAISWGLRARAAPTRLLSGGDGVG